jgi:hypothetical protein
MIFFQKNGSRWEVQTTGVARNFNIREIEFRTAEDGKKREIHQSWCLKVKNGRKLR